jgi:putative photosynthetic complex assembly protein
MIQALVARKPRVIALGMVLAGALGVYVVSSATNSKVDPRSEPAVASIALSFEDQPGGIIVIRNADTHTNLKTLQAGEGAFIRGVVRGLVRERRMEANNTRLPFALSRHRDGSVWLQDPVTGRNVALNAFGSENAGQFAGLLCEVTGGCHEEVLAAVKPAR